MNKEMINLALFGYGNLSNFLRDTTTNKLLRLSFNEYMAKARKLYPFLMTLKNFRSIDEIEARLVEGYVLSKWYAEKIVYDFDKNFVQQLINTEDSPIYTDILKRLPFSTYMVELPAGLDSYMGMIVRFEYIEKTDEVLLVSCLLGKHEAHEICYNESFLSFKNGENFAQSLSDFAKEQGLPPEFIEKNVKELKFAVYSAYYLASKNAVIHDVTPPRPKRPHGKKVKGEKKPPNVRTYEAGYRLAESFEAQMRKQDTAVKVLDTPAGTGGTKTPHMRRAHWHHYWTGEGRTTREVRWIEPVFVGNTNKAVPVVRKVAGRCAEGEQNG